MWWSDYWPMPGIFFGPIMMIAFVIACMALMFFLMRGGMMRGNRRQDPIDILKERFARGEIGQAEYEERRRLLQA
jgi:putative membrane protein